MGMTTRLEAPAAHGVEARPNSPPMSALQVGRRSNAEKLQAHQRPTTSTFPPHHNPAAPATVQRRASARTGTGRRGLSRQEKIQVRRRKVAGIFLVRQPAQRTVLGSQAGNLLESWFLENRGQGQGVDAPLPHHYRCALPKRGLQPDAMQSGND